MDKILSFVRDESGLTIVEYAVAGSLITAAVVTAFTGLGEAVRLQIVRLTGAITPAAIP